MRSLTAAFHACSLFMALVGYSQPRTELTIAARLDQAVGNITFTPDRRIIFSYHPFFAPPTRVAELLPDGTTRPFPSAGWNDPKAPESSRLDNVLGLRGDRNGIVWILDAAGRSARVPKIVAWNTRKNALERIIALPPPVSHPHSFFNDLIVDSRHHAIYIADEGIGAGGDGTRAGLVVVDLETGEARRLLEGHRSVLPEAIPLQIGKYRLETEDANGNVRDLHVGADGLVSDQRDEWLYFGALSSTSLYRVRTEDILDRSLTPAQLEGRVERYSDKPINGGLAIDRDDNLYLTVMGKNAVGIIGRDRKYRTLITSPDLQWPDGVSYSPDGFMYVSAAQVHLAGVFNDGKAENKAPYLIFRFKPLANGILGK